MENFPVDIVLPWVDGSKNSWRERFYVFNGDKTIDERRYRDFGLLDFVLYGIEINMPWVNSIFLITDNQTPNFKLPPNVIILDHSEIISKEKLPVFNSNSIELSCYKIKQLSEHFILFNDDIFVLKRMKKDDFFDKNGQPRDNGAMLCRSPMNEFEHTVLNNLIIINKLINKKDMIRKYWDKFFNIQYGRYALKSILTVPWFGITGWHDFHLPVAFKKSSFMDLSTRIPRIWDEQLNRRTRSKEDISPWIVRYWQLANGDFIPTRVDLYGKMIELKDGINIQDLMLQFSSNKILCLNDDISDDLEYIRIKKKLRIVINKYFEMNGIEIDEKSVR